MFDFDSFLVVPGGRQRQRATAVSALSSQAPGSAISNRSIQSSISIIQNIGQSHTHASITTDTYDSRHTFSFQVSGAPTTQVLPPSSSLPTPTPATHPQPTAHTHGTSPTESPPTTEGERRARSDSVGGATLAGGAAHSAAAPTLRTGAPTVAAPTRRPSSRGCTGWTRRSPGGRRSRSRESTASRSRSPSGQRG